MIIDEMGRQKFSGFETDLFGEIIDRRYNNTVFTTLITNLTVAEFSTLYDIAVLDRLRPEAVVFEWESMR